MATLVVRRFNEKQEYSQVHQRMQQFTAARNETTPDELWLLEHHAVYTQGLAGKAEHILHAGDTPVIQSDRGGQVTWHGPGQLMIYTLLDTHRLKWGARILVNALENTLITWLDNQGVKAFSQTQAPGVYVHGKDGTAEKIAALGLRISKKGCYHGMALNISNNLSPFAGINPCGTVGLRVARLDQYVSPLPACSVIEKTLAAAFAQALQCSSVEWKVAE